MTGLTENLGKPFDVLFAITSNETVADDETVEDGLYADTRPKGGVHSITSTQSGESTYAAYDAADSRADAPREAEPSDRSDSRTRSTRRPVVTDD
ncbi:hypothetical protein GRX01_12275 [Halobaculum sp. WSA2]|uniref:Uncharacterized protein n=1 Tax=Halobaculum saliterrae TaxID=2073113 RepID=A0A6B0T0G2_9EURY|nr:hypothetical protein [Halobaculum saliterrae]MXR42112.1 hypothetical protein [Halobaculum saliterrae]